ncbi:hypothetical protein FKW31_13290 [Acetobacter sp. DmW_136]|uniref:hypothetical protein n=1 Tax=Acetobacter sp. DmW_136 TaxID=2591091 RepID=UPI00123C73D6|nr:hypothetical protein [Acetobacter sp. DmW_136]KAA8384136.1 hypothetical protein FKW31_13290 [Acetobacter sp. DmW_136]
MSLTDIGGMHPIHLSLHQVSHRLACRNIDNWLKKTQTGTKTGIEDILLEGDLSSSRGPIGSARLRGTFKLHLLKKNTMK